MARICFAVFLLITCTNSCYGCVTGAGPSWELGREPQASGRRGRFGSQHVLSVNAKLIPSNPSIPSVVQDYFAGRVTKEYAFSELDENQDGQVSSAEWSNYGGALQEFNAVLSRLDENSDGLISLAELRPFHLSVDSTPSNLGQVLRTMPTPQAIPVDLVGGPEPQEIPALHETPLDLLMDPRLHERPVPWQTPSDPDSEESQDPYELILELLRGLRTQNRPVPRQTPIDLLRDPRPHVRHGRPGRRQNQMEQIRDLGPQQRPTPPGTSFEQVGDQELHHGQALGRTTLERSGNMRPRVRPVSRPNRLHAVRDIGPQVRPREISCNPLSDPRPYGRPARGKSRGMY